MGVNQEKVRIWKMLARNRGHSGCSFSSPDPSLSSRRILPSFCTSGTQSRHVVPSHPSGPSNSRQKAVVKRTNFVTSSPKKRYCVSV